MRGNGRAGSRMTGMAHLYPGWRAGAKIRGIWRVECRAPDKRLKWVEDFENLVVNVGLDHLLDVTLSAATQVATWYLSLINGASPTIAAGDTMASHAGWTENQNYSEAVRQTWIDGGVSGQSVSNSASPATFTCNTDGQTIGGAFLTSGNAKGGTTGTLYAAGTFASAKSLDTNDTLDVTATFTMADDGV
jgi:hypothetical protein